MSRSCLFAKSGDSLWAAAAREGDGFTVAQRCRLVVMTPCRYCAPFLLVVSLVMSPVRDASGESNPSSAQSSGLECPQESTLTIVGRGTTVCRPVSTTWTTIRVPKGGRIFVTRDPPPEHFQLDHEKDSRVVQVSAKLGAPAGEEMSIKVFHNGKYSATIILRIVSRQSDSLGEYVLEHITEAEARRRNAVRSQLALCQKEKAQATSASAQAQQEAVDANDARMTAEATAAEASKQAEKDRAQARASEARARKEVASARAETRRAEADAAQARAEATQAKAEAADAKEEAADAKEEAADAKEETKAAKEETKAAKEGQERAQRDMLTTVAAEIFDEEPVRLSPEAPAQKPVSGRLSTEFLDGIWKNEYFLLGSVLRLAPGRPVEVVAVKVRRGKTELATRVVSPDATPLPSTAAIGTLVPGKEKRVAFAIDVPPDTDLVGANLELYVKGQSAPLLFEIPRYYQRVSPISEAEYQRMQWAKQVVIGPRLALGGCWLSSGLDGDDDLSATRCTVAGAYVTQGVSDLFALGVDAVGGWSRNAQFDREPADITRSANLFQIMAFADARLRRGRHVPYLRFGLGGLVASYNEGDSEFEFPFYAVGGGLLARIGKHFSIAAGGMVVGIGNGQPRSLRVDLRMGYGWNP